MPNKNLPAPRGKLRTQEIVRCGTDPIYFMKRYGYISHATRGLIKFETFDFQDECVANFEAHRFNIVLKSRQLGLSTVCAGYVLWLALFQQEKNILVIATKQTVSQEFLRKVCTMYDNLPAWLVLPKEKSRTNKTLEFSNGSRITAIPTSDEAGRSMGISVLVVDEAAHIERFDIIWGGLWPVVSTGGQIILLSSPQGVGNVFHKIWSGCDQEKKENDFHGIRLPWIVHPEHDDKWFEEQCRNLDPRLINQEFLCVGQDTKIVTVNGYTKAKDIIKGDLVLTHKGRFRKVLNIKKRFLNSNENLYKINVPLNRQDPLFITGNHPIYSTCFYLPGGKNKWKYFTDNNFEPEFIDLDTLDKFCDKTNKKKFGVLSHQFLESELNNSLRIIDLVKLVESPNFDLNFCSYKNQKGNGKKNFNKTKRFIEVNKELGKFIGLTVAEGCIHVNTSKTGNKVKNLQLSFHRNEKETLVKFIKDFYDKCGFSYHIDERKYSKCIVVETSNKYVLSLYEFFVNNNSGATTKNLKFEKFLETNKEFILGYLIGHFDGDGDHEQSIKRHNLSNKLKLVSFSEKLLYQVRILISLFGHYPRIGYLKEKPVYIEFDGLRYQNIFNIEGLLSATRNKIEQPTSKVKLHNLNFYGDFQYKLVQHLNVNYVVDIEVEEDQSFVAGCLVVHNCEFLGSGRTFIHEDSINWIMKSVKEPIKKLGKDLNTWVWEDPIPEHKYIITADISRGDSEDYSTCHVIDTMEDEVVVEYQGKIPPDRFAEYLIELGKMYNTALICPELNSFGLIVSYKLRDEKYPNLYYEKFAKNGVYQTYNEEDVKDLAPGINVTVKNRQAILNKLEEALRNKSIKVYSSRFAEETKTFIWNNRSASGKAEAMKGYNDDLISAMGIACFIYEAPENKVDNEKLNQAMMAAFSRSTTHLTTNTNPSFLDPSSNQQINGGSSMAFQRTASGFQANNQNQNRFYPNQPNNQNTPMGVDPRNLRNSVNIHNAYSWLFNKDGK